MFGAALVIGVAALFFGPIPQPLSYHHFADQRAFFGIPNFGDVASNLAFGVVGIWGLAFLLASDTDRLRRSFVDDRERIPYLCVFLGLLLTAFGSSYYHLAPDNARLVWDRLPMTIVFAGLVSAVISERIDVKGGLALLPLLLLAGASSVIQWYHSELHGHGDLRFYAAVQLYSALILIIALFVRPKYSREWDFGIVAGFYLLAKIFEAADTAIFNSIHFMSGHTLKHLAAAMAGYWILRMLQIREPVVMSQSRTVSTSA